MIGFIKCRNVTKFLFYSMTLFFICLLFFKNVLVESLSFSMHILIQFIYSDSFTFLILISFSCLIVVVTTTLCKIKVVRVDILTYLKRKVSVVNIEYDVSYVFIYILNYTELNYFYYHFAERSFKNA